MGLMDFLRTVKTTYQGEVISPDYPRNEPKGFFERGSEITLNTDNIPQRKVKVIGNVYEYQEIIRQWQHTYRINQVRDPENLPGNSITPAYLFPLNNGKSDLVIPLPFQKNYNLTRRLDEDKWEIFVDTNSLPNQGERIALIEPRRRIRGMGYGAGHRNTMLCDVMGISIDDDFFETGKPVRAYVTVDEILGARIEVLDQEHVPALGYDESGQPRLGIRQFRTLSSEIPTLRNIRDMQKEALKPLIPAQ